VYDFLLVINSNLGPISHRYWDTATYWPKIANFAHPLSFSKQYNLVPASLLRRKQAHCAIHWPRIHGLSVKTGVWLRALVNGDQRRPMGRKAQKGLYVFYLSFSTLVWGDPLRIYGKTSRFLKLVFRAADGEDLVILTCTFFDWSTRVMDRQTDRQTEVWWLRHAESSSCFQA